VIARLFQDFTVTSTTEGSAMNWDRIEGNWKQAAGLAKQQWGKLTDDDLVVASGHRKHLAGRIQERYGIAKDEIERQIAAWERQAHEAVSAADKD
jgi:uncharacterized protein YjbJ (UPF0337 family)